MHWYLEVFRKYAVFSGRARRKEYWCFTLLSILVSLLLLALDLLLGTFNMEAGIGLLTGLYSLAILIPNFAVTVRRLHDTGRSGWAMLLMLIPLVGPLVLLVYTLSDSEWGDNQYGPNPKADGFFSLRESSYSQG